MSASAKYCYLQRLEKYSLFLPVHPDAGHVSLNILRILFGVILQLAVSSVSMLHRSTSE